MCSSFGDRRNNPTQIEYPNTITNNIITASLDPLSSIDVLFLNDRSHLPVCPIMARDSRRKSFVSILKSRHKLGIDRALLEGNIRRADASVPQIIVPTIP